MSQRRELNPRPLPYQGNALPLSYVGFFNPTFSGKPELRWFSLFQVLLQPNSATPTCNSKLKNRAGDQVRTGDLQLGRLSLYQLSYTRLFLIVCTGTNPSVQCGENRIRTCEDISQQIYSLPQLAALVSPR